MDVENTRYEPGVCNIGPAEIARRRRSGHVGALITIGLLGFDLYQWLTNSSYGVNNRDSLYYMGAMYLLAIVLYIAARVIRKRQGIDLGLINKEIPVE